MTAPSVDKATFRAGLAAFVGNGGVITVAAGGEATGLVCTSVVSPSADPPLLLLALNTASSSWRLLAQAGCFGWSTLAPHQQAVAERFSGLAGVEGAARYDGADWDTAVTGARLLRGAPAAFDCVLHETIDRGAYAIVTGRVVAVRTAPADAALVWWRGAFRGLTG